MVAALACARPSDPRDPGCRHGSHLHNLPHTHLKSKQVVIINRFCSALEFVRYMSGEHLHNFTDHYRGGRGGSLSRGFCFFAGNIAEWARRLNGLVDFDVLLTVDVDRKLVHCSTGVYADWSRDNGRSTPPRILVPELCTEDYDNARFAFIRADRSFSDDPRYISRSQLGL